MNNETKSENDANNDSNTGILDQARLRPQLNGWRPSNGNVINTLIELKSSGLLDKTIKHIFAVLSSWPNIAKG